MMMPFTLPTDKEFSFPLSLENFENRGNSFGIEKRGSSFFSIFFFSCPNFFFFRVMYVFLRTQAILIHQLFSLQKCLNHTIHKER